MRIPAFVDLQVNGYLGVDFSDPALTPEAFRDACRALLAGGTGAFLPTMVTCAPATYRRNLALMAEALEEKEFAGRLLGFHVEGPFISPEAGAVGAHDPALVREPDPDLLDRLADWGKGKVRLLTVAAERKGAPGLIKRATGLGMTVSLGHHLASGDDLRRAVKAGARALTHLGNGIPNVLPRHPNPIWEGLAEDALVMMVIADGHHLPPATLKSMLKAKGTAKSVIVSDAAALSGKPPGRYSWHGAELVLEENGRLHDPARKCLAGSSSTMLECMNFLAARGWYGQEELVRLGVDNPLALIGLDRGIMAGGNEVEYEEGRGFRLAA